MHPSQITYLATRRPEPELYRQGFVVARAKRHRRLSVIAALYRALAPLSVLNPRADREQTVCCG
jgi:hypothetical protein